MVNIGVPELLIVCALPLAVTGVIAGIILFVWMLSRGGNAAVTRSATPRETPLDILKARYARGELTKEQFDQMRKDLES